MMGGEIMKKSKKKIGLSMIPISPVFFEMSNDEQREWAKRYLKKIFKSFQPETEDKKIDS